MAFIGATKEKISPQVKTEDKVIVVEAGMQGNITFSDPINLCIDGKFEGTLNSRGNLSIGKEARVEAHITGENIVISGRVKGTVTATGSLTLTQTAHLEGDISTPRLSVSGGAVFQGKCAMEEKEISPSAIQEAFMTAEELAKYLKVEVDAVLNWAKKGRVPAQKYRNNWRFEREKIDAWVAAEKIESEKTEQ